MSLQFAFFAIGLALLYNGADWLVRGSASLAKKIGFSPMLIGLTVVAFGTSAPELLVSLVSLWRDKSMLAIGNIVGSNICNFTMVIGIIALIKPITTNKTVLHHDIPVMLFSAVALLILSLNSIISRFDGIMLFIGAISYICFKYKTSKKNERTLKYASSDLAINQYKKKDTKQIRSQILTVLIGTISIVVGAKLLVNAAIEIMIILNISEKCIGLTIVAVGTSIPELATSIIAIMRKEVDILIGNLVGSNIFNILSVVGITATIQPIILEKNIIQSGLILDYAVMIFTSSLPLLLMKKNRSITKSNGSILTGIYILYSASLFCRIQ